MLEPRRRSASVSITAINRQNTIAAKAQGVPAVTQVPHPKIKSFNHFTYHNSSPPAGNSYALSDSGSSTHDKSRTTFNTSESSAQKSNAQLNSSLIFNGPVMYKSSTSDSYEPAWMRFKESTSILTIYSADPYKSSSSVKTVGFIEVSRWSMRSKQSSKRVRLEIISNNTPQRFRFDSVEEAMMLVEALDRCLGHYEAYLASRSPSPIVRRAKSYRHTKSSGISDPHPLSTSSTSRSTSSTASLSSSSSPSSPAPKYYHTSGRRDSREEVLYDLQNKKTSLKSVLKGSPTAVYVLNDGSDYDAIQRVARLIQRDGAFLRNRGIKAVIVGYGIKKIVDEFKKKALEVPYYEDKTGQLARSFCHGTRDTTFKDCLPPAACFLLFDETRNIIFSSSISDKRPAMDEIVDAVDIFVED